MAIDILFSRLLKEDFPSIRQSLEGIVNKKDVAYVVGANYIPVDNEVLLRNDYSTFLQHYEIDKGSKLALDNSTPEELKVAFSELSNEGFQSSFADQDLYKFASEKGWLIRHEIIPPKGLYGIQANDLLIKLTPFLLRKLGPKSEYLQSMREALEQHKQLTYARDNNFLVILKSHNKKNRQVVSVRAPIHNYLEKMLYGKGINFHGFKGTLTDNFVIKIMHKNLRFEEISDKELVEFYVEANSIG